MYRGQHEGMTLRSTVGALRAEAIARLAPRLEHDAAAAALDAELLLAHVLGVTRARLSAHADAPVDADGGRRFRALLERRASGEPLAYLTGVREFWSLPLQVSPAVLVPRPETELLVERALALRAAPEGRVADLGTGCGAIALALASERPRWQVIATDVSAAALEVARANAATLHLSGVRFRQGSWFEALAGERCDLLLSNPPYVACDDAAMSGAALAHEPRLALTPGADALECLRAIVRGAPRHLSAGAWLLLEHGAGQAAQVRQLLVATGFGSVRSHRDLAGHERMTEGQYGQI
jgi:release factor glutamine methyltransferase